MPSQYEKLRDKLNKMFPERTELGFGCEVRTKYRTDIVLFDKCQSSACTNETRPVLHYNNSCAAQAHFDKEEILEILGTPVTIAEVLRAIDMAEGKEYGIEGFYLYADGSTSYDVLGFGHRTTKHGPVFPLHLPVSEWPDETIEKILELI